MQERRNDVPVLSLADATGVWAVRTDDGLTYLVDADAGALHLRKPPPRFDKVLGRRWLRITTVRRATGDQVSVLRVGVAHHVGLVAADDAEAEAFHALSTVRAIRPATDEEISGLAPRLGGLPRGVFLTGGRTALSLADEVGVWAVHGRADERVVFLNIGSRTVLSQTRGEAGRWSRLDRFRGAPAAPRGVVRVGDRAVFEANGLPRGLVRLESATLVRKVLGDELASLPARLARRPSTSRVVLPAGEHAVLELPGEEPVVFDQQLATDLFDTCRPGRTRPSVNAHAWSWTTVPSSSSMAVTSAPNAACGCCVRRSSRRSVRRCATPAGRRRSPTRRTPAC